MVHSRNSGRFAKSKLSVIVLGLAMLGVLTLRCRDDGTDLPVIAIMQHQPASWADDVRRGFLDRLGERGKTVDEHYELKYQHGTADTQSLPLIAESFVAAEVDVIFAISTQAAQAAVAQARGRMPVLFGAVTDPISAGLVRSLALPDGEVTGTSDQWPVRDQLKLFREVRPDFSRLGVLHNPGEDNSVANMVIVREAARLAGWSLHEVGVASSTDVHQAAELMAPQVDGIYIPASNTVLQSTEAIVAAANLRSLPLIAGVADSVRRGAHATYSLSYYELGRLNADQAYALVWEGKGASELRVQVPTEYDLIVNVGSMQKAGLQVPARWLADAAELIP